MDIIDVMEYYEEKIKTLLRTVSRSQMQMRLSSMADRDLALALEGVVYEDGLEILSRLPEAKAKRVRQEQEYLGRLRVTASQRRTMAERLADAMEGKGRDTGGTWIAPGRSRKGRRR